MGKTGGALITVTRVVVSRDLGEAQVYFSWTPPSSMSPDPEEVTNRVKEALGGLAPELSRRLWRRLRIKRLPQFIFEHDVSLESADRIYGILEKLAMEKKDQ